MNKTKRTCTNCFNIKSVDDFSPINIKKYGADKKHGICKKCRNLIISQRKLIKEVEARNIKVKTCSDELCGYMWKRIHVLRCKICNSLGV